LLTIEVGAEELALEEAVRTYLFNSQLLTLPDGGMELLCPAECIESPSVQAVLGRIVAEDNPITEVQFVDVRQSMHNGGGPACLRLRVVLTEEELAAVHRPLLLTERLYGDLVVWVERHYREDLTPGDLADPRLREESLAALEELAGRLELGAVYPFQGVLGE